MHAQRQPSSAVSAAGGRNGRALLETFPRQDAALFFS